nr:MAG TPA: hypothetical protein [Caudoviricetes sp.]
MNCIILSSTINSKIRNYFRSFRINLWLNHKIY